MYEQLVAYINWERITSWKILSLSFSEDELIPFAYGSRQAVFQKYAKKANVIWVFSIPMVEDEKSKKLVKYRPTLVAKIVIDEVLNCSSSLKKFKNKREIEKLRCLWGVVAIADRTKSQFYELNDATELLMEKISFKSKTRELYLKDTFGENWKTDKLKNTQKIRQHIAKNLRFIRLVNNTNSNNIAELNEFTEKIKKRSIFISYAFADKIKQSERSTALALADCLLEKEWSPWLDSLVINPRKKRSATLIPKKRLQHLLEFGISGCPVFVALVSKNYIQSDNRKKLKWTLQELETAKNNRKTGHVKTMLQIKLDEKELPGFDKTFCVKDEKELATDITNYYTKNFSNV